LQEILRSEMQAQLKIADDSAREMKKSIALKEQEVLFLKSNLEHTQAAAREAAARDASALKIERELSAKEIAAKVEASARELVDGLFYF
jgi:hypothetical protein